MPTRNSCGGRTGAHHVDVNVVGSDGEVQRRTDLADPGQDGALDTEILVPQLGSLRDRLVGGQVVVDGVGQAPLDEETERADDDDRGHDPLAPRPEGLPRGAGTAEDRLPGRLAGGRRAAQAGLRARHRFGALGGALSATWRPSFGYQGTPQRPLPSQRSAAE